MKRLPPSIRDLPIENSTLLIRVDFNVPITESGTILDDTRIKASLPTIEYALSKNCKIVLISHLGRPKTPSPAFSLNPCAAKLSTLLKKEVRFITDPISTDVAETIKRLPAASISLLENIRFYPEEENPNLNLNFAKELSSLGDFYINDAFAASHRNHSSITLLASYFPNRCGMGFLLEKEIKTLSNLLTTPKRPFFAILGGSKISSKLPLLEALSSKVDALFIGGAMSYSLLKAKGISIGNSLCEWDLIGKLQSWLKTLQIPLYLPIDLLVAKEATSNSPCHLIQTATGIEEGWEGVDIGPATLHSWQEILKEGNTIFWNGPVGIFEIENFSKGTLSLAKMIGSFPDKTTVVGGGDSVAAIEQFHLSSSFSHISTGGGATLEFLESGTLPGITALLTPKKSEQTPP